INLHLSTVSSIGQIVHAHPANHVTEHDAYHILKWSTRPVLGHYLDPSLLGVRLALDAHQGRWFMLEFVRHPNVDFDANLADSGGIGVHVVEEPKLAGFRGGN